MKKKMAFTLFLAAFLAVTLFSGNGQTPSMDDKIPIQGKLTDVAGIPLNGPYAITASIYNVDVGGIALSTESETVTVAMDGKCRTTGLAITRAREYQRAKEEPCRPPGSRHSHRRRRHRRPRRGRRGRQPPPRASGALRPRVRPGHRQQDSRSAAERELRERERRHAELELTPLSPESRARYAAAWEELQVRFVDSPAETVGEADELVSRLIAERGYPTGDFSDRSPTSPSNTPAPSPTTATPTRSGSATSAVRPAPRTSGRRWCTTGPSSPNCSARTRSPRSSRSSATPTTTTTTTTTSRAAEEAAPCARRNNRSRRTTPRPSGPHRCRCQQPGEHADADRRDADPPATPTAATPTGPTRPRTRWTTGAHSTTRRSPPSGATPRPTSGATP